MPTGRGDGERRGGTVSSHGCRLTAGGRVSDRPPSAKGVATMGPRSFLAYESRDDRVRARTASGTSRSWRVSVYGQAAWTEARAWLQEQGEPLPGNPTEAEAGPMAAAVIAEPELPAASLAAVSAAPEPPAAASPDLLDNPAA